MVQVGKAVVAVALLAPGAAAAQTRALLLQDANPAGTTSIVDELDAQGVPYDLVSSLEYPSVDLFDYSMILVAGCQSSFVHDAWNMRRGQVQTFVDAGGYVAIHAGSYCGDADGSTMPQPPGGDLTWFNGPQSTGTVLGVGDPLVAGISTTATGAPLARARMGGTVIGDSELLVVGGDPVLVRRVFGAGQVVVSTLTLEEGYRDGRDPGVVLENEIAQGWALGALCVAQPDSDGDGRCDLIDLCPGSDDDADADLDSVPDACDTCPGTIDADFDGVCDDVDACLGVDDAIDADADGVPDACDNCVNDSNPSQDDSDFDGEGDACDACFNTGSPADADNDGWINSCDVCPWVPDPLQEDSDGDGVGDLCDNCPDDANVDQFDWDLDEIGDACDLCMYGENGRDADGDGVPDACDPCPDDPGDDSDGDGVCDGVDLCPGVDDALDSDGDTIPDACDNCPDDYNRPQNDVDGDGFGSACDCDDRNPEALPGGVEVCDLADNDCNGFVDDVDGEINVFWPDFDGDGSGDPTGQPVEACEQPIGYAIDFGDCDDRNPERSPNAIEWCDDIDNDCDGIVDGPRCTPEAACTGCAAEGALPGNAWVGLVGLIAAVRRRRAG